MGTKAFSTSAHVLALARVDPSAWLQTDVMNGAMACPNCGSWAVLADRSLAGRMVCGRCGEPLAKSGRSKSRLSPRLVRARRDGRLKFWLGLMALVTASAVLAVMAERWPSSPKRENFDHITHQILR